MGLYARKTLCFRKKIKGPLQLKTNFGKKSHSTEKKQSADPLVSSLLLQACKTFVQCETRIHVLPLLGPQKLLVNLYFKWHLEDTSYYELKNFNESVRSLVFKKKSLIYSALSTKTSTKNANCNRLHAFAYSSN